MNSLQQLLQTYKAESWFSDEELDSLQEDFYDISEEEGGVSALPVFLQSLVLIAEDGLLTKDSLWQAFRCYKLTSLYEQLQILKEANLLNANNLEILLEKNGSSLFPLLFKEAHRLTLLSNKVLESIQDDTRAGVRLHILNLVESEKIKSSQLFKSILLAPNPTALLMSLEVLADVGALESPAYILERLYDLMNLPLIKVFLEQALLKESISAERLYLIARESSPLVEKVLNLFLLCQQQKTLAATPLSFENEAQLYVSLTFLACTAKTANEFKLNLKLWQQMEKGGYRLSSEHQTSLQAQLLESAGHAEFIRQELIFKPAGLMPPAPKLLFNLGATIQSSVSRYLNACWDLTIPKTWLVAPSLPTISATSISTKALLARQTLDIGRFDCRDGLRETMLSQGSLAANSYLNSIESQRSNFGFGRFFKKGIAPQPLVLEDQARKTKEHDGESINTLS